MAKRRPSKPAPAAQVGAEVVKPEVTPAEPVEAQAAGDGVKFACKKHGDITNATLHMTFAGKDGEKQGQFLYCLHCLNEVLLSLQKGGAIETVQIVVPEEVAKVMAEQKAARDAEASVEQPAPDAAALINEMTAEKVNAPVQ